MNWLMSTYDVILEQDEHVLLSTTEILHEEHYDGTFLLVNASGKTLSQPHKTVFFIMWYQILVVISTLTSWSCVCEENTDSPLSGKTLV